MLRWIRQIWEGHEHRENFRADRIDAIGRNPISLKRLARVCHRVVGAGIEDGRPACCETSLTLPQRKHMGGLRHDLAHSGNIRINNEEQDVLLYQPSNLDTPRILTTLCVCV